MVVRTFLLVILLLSIYEVRAQPYRLIGNVYNEKNEPVAGVTVQVNGNVSTQTNVTGAFQAALPAGKYELTFSAVGYETKIISDIEVGAGLSNELNVTLLVKAKEQESVVITARTTQRRETVNSLIAFQKNTNTVASVISAETIRRSPDRNTGEVLKRTPGASLQDGRFIIVRGLADRYNQAMLNGVLLTSTEPDRKTFSFDLIPAQMIDNIIINKAFVPELPGEWAGGLIQVNTRDIPSRNFLNIQVGTGFNTQTIGRTFYSDRGGKLDWLGIDDGYRGLPAGYSTKSGFDRLSPAEKTAIGKQMRNDWVPVTSAAPLNAGFQLNGGFASRFLGKNIGGTFGITYNKSNRYLELLNRNNSLVGNLFSTNSSYNDDRYAQDIAVGALAGVTLQLNSSNRIAAKTVINVNTANTVTQRQGTDFNRGDDVQGTEFNFRQNTFYTVQVTGDHKLATPVQLKCYGSFNILDGYVPDQRRILYTRASGSSDPFLLLVSNTLSQQSGSRIFQNLSDYIYTAGGDVSYNFTVAQKKQTLKAGYMFQVKDRLYDAKLFANYLPLDNPDLRALSPDQVFAPENFGDGTGKLFGFDAIKGNTFRYMANTILNAGFLQLDNQLSPALRVVWGVRAEHFDQLVGSVQKTDPRHTYTKVLDFLPGMNTTLKIGTTTNVRLSASQTVIRPELRELSFLNLYDFELNASVQGKPSLKRTKVSNLDLRYEWYPRSGEMLTVGGFYKHFKNPIEQIFSEGIGGASTFSYQNPEMAYSFGMELEYRKRLDFVNALKNFTFQGNAALIRSKVQDQGLNIDRPLQGQSPYLLNLGLMYDLPQQGFTATVLYNQIGERIYLVGDLTGGAGSPDIYEASRPQVDFQLSKKFLKDKAELKLNISNLLDNSQYFYQNADDDKSFDRSDDAYRFTRRFGTTYSISLNYSL
ncbi:MAG TPA: TonB-dependent receptor [Flavisolibacter sp.]